MNKCDVLINFYKKENKYLIEYIFTKNDYILWKEIFLYHIQNVDDYILLENNEEINLFILETNLKNINKILVISKQQTLHSKNIFLDSNVNILHNIIKCPI